jgi:hypothetical protein
VRELTEDEERAIRSLKRLSRKWPASLKLFAWNGSLCVMENYVEPGHDAVLDYVAGIPCDGGDP